MPRKGRKRKPGTPRKKRVRDALAARLEEERGRNYVPSPVYLWPHQIDLEIGDFLEVLTAKDEPPIRGTLIALNRDRETITLDRDSADRIQITAPWCMRKVNLLERIVLEVADAEKQAPSESARNKAP